jgi:hypothetical protein
VTGVNLFVSITTSDLPVVRDRHRIYVPCRGDHPTGFADHRKQCRNRKCDATVCEGCCHGSPCRLRGRTRGRPPGGDLLRRGLLDRNLLDCSLLRRFLCSRSTRPRRNPLGDRLLLAAFLAAAALGAIAPSSAPAIKNAVRSLALANDTGTGLRPLRYPVNCHLAPLQGRTAPPLVRCRQ